MDQLELKLWKEELLVQKEKNSVMLKEIKHQLDRHHRRLNFILDIKEQLHSSLMHNLERRNIRFVEQSSKVSKRK